MDNWRSGADVGDVFQLEGDFEGRLGSNCWAAGRLRAGDLIMAIAHKGDAFHDYVLLNHSVVRNAGEPGKTKLMVEAVRSPFGAYRTGRFLFGINRIDRAWLMGGGDALSLPMPEGYVATPHEERVAAGLRNQIKSVDAA